MSIAPSTRLGPYEIISQIGAGGMGEVYKARDTRLDRVVAIKVLPAHLADRPDLRERFEREARTIAGLNHPHICTLYDIGQQDGIAFLVMEYLEGETLAMRLRKGPLPVQQVLEYAIEISDALDKAHRKGVTHRDIKPGNIMLVPQGGIGSKLLDFGLAKLKQEVAPSVPASQLPTLRENPTVEGTILGTLQYMSPEQLEGKVDEIDGRTDIFSFGAVVYEMATGKKAFEGKSSVSLIGAILKDNPAPMSSLQPMTPPALDRVVRKCLAKEPDRRWQAASDVCDELKWIAEGGSQASVPVPAAAAPQRQSKHWFAWASVAAALVVALLVASAAYFRRAPAELPAVRFTVNPPGMTNFPDSFNFLSVSPDGSKLAFVAVDSSAKVQLWVRALDSPTAQPLPGTESASHPFWSPDSRFIGFYADGRLKKISVSGGPAQTVVESATFFGGSWSREGVVLFARGAPNVIYRVSAAGGEAAAVTSLDGDRQETFHQWPYFLPDGDHFLYLARGSKLENNAIYVGSLNSKERKLLLNATSNPAYVPPGYLLFNRAGTLMAQPFNAERLELTGEAVPIAEGVGFSPATGRTAFAASENGVLAHRTGGAGAQRRLVWVSRNGVEQPLPSPVNPYGYPRLAPDGRRIAVEVDTQIWLYDLTRDTLTRFSFLANSSQNPFWTPDGKRIVYISTSEGPINLFWQPADGSGGPERLTTSPLAQQPASWSPDGTLLAYHETGTATRRDIWVLRLSDRKAQPFLQTPFTEGAPTFSPDGRWLTYVSDESGRPEIYVRPYPGPGGKWQISTDGGTEPVWNRSGLYFRSGSKMMTVDVTTQPTFSAGNPKMLFEGPQLTPTFPALGPAYDVTPDGQRFLVVKEIEQAGTPLSIVLNWPEDLKRGAPAGKQ